MRKLKNNCVANSNFVMDVGLCRHYIQ